jgi:hypothetical protein
MQLAATGYRLWTAPVQMDDTGLVAGKPELFLETPFDQRHPSFSPDGHWMAYASNESGTFEVYVRAFPDKGGQWQVSNGGGVYPMWSHDGKGVFFRNYDKQIVMAAYRVKGDSFVIDKPRLWSEKHLANFGPVGAATFDVAPDGKRIVALMSPGGAEAQEHHVIFLENFFDELRRRVPTNH